MSLNECTSFTLADFETFTIREGGTAAQMSFEDGGDLASFAAIAESTIVNKEGTILNPHILSDCSEVNHFI